MPKPWLIIVLAALALLVFLTLSGRLTPQATLEQGTLIIERGSHQIGQESFELHQTQSGRVLTSTVTLTGLNTLTPITMSQELLLTSDWLPLHYRMAADLPQEGKRQYAVTIGREGAQLETITIHGLAQHSLSGEPPWIVLDTSIFSDYIPLYKLIRAASQAGRKFHGTALVPQAELTLSLQVQTASTRAEIHSGTRKITLDEYALIVGDELIELYGKADTLYVVNFPKSSIVAYRKELLPSIGQASP